MKYAFTGGMILDGTKDMQPKAGLCILTDGEKITDIVSDRKVPAGYEKIDLGGKYIMPGLINMHVHLAGSGKPQKKQRDNEKLVKKWEPMRSQFPRRQAPIRITGLHLRKVFSQSSRLTSPN